MEPMSNATENATLCKRCSLLNFDDLALGGQEVVNEDGIAQFHFPDARIETRPKYCTQDQPPPDYYLVRLDWHVEDSLPDMPELSGSCQLGCVFCQALLRSLEDAFATGEKSYTVHDGTLNLVAYLSLVDEGIQGLLIETTFNQNWGSEQKRVIQSLFPIEADSNCEKWLRAQPARETSYLNPINIGTIQRFLDQCTSKCHPEISSSFMPTRFVDVGHDASVLPRLVLSSKICQPEQTKYAALSYCWGNKKDAESQSKTEKASLEDRCISLPSELMTPTTKDAIAITRAIGLRYIWIDALCIIQDDKDDWSHESSRMNLVYRHAFITFCSLNSSSCHESFLNRAPAVKVPFQSTIHKAINGSYLIRLQPRTVPAPHLTKYMSDYRSSNWSERCWTYQEKEMSTRLLLFGSLKMHFACGRYRWTEGDELSVDITTSRILSQVTRFKESRITSRELYQCWDSLITEYGRRSVTFDNDRLPALAGLARTVGEALQDQYLAGLWKGDLLEGLLWESTGAMLSCGLEVHLQNIRQRNYVAPSWSWAACPAVRTLKATQDLRQITQEATVSDVGVDTDSEDPYGRISGGFLRIRGKLAGVPTWLPKYKNNWSNYWCPFTGDVGCIYAFTDWLHIDKEAGLDLLVAMLLFRIEPHHETEAPALQALLLYPADRLKHYYRVGTIKSTGPDGYKEMADWFKDNQEDTICII